MKIDRLIGIITILLQKEKQQYPSWRSGLKFQAGRSSVILIIYVKAGIPIVSMQGYGGGLSIAEGYKINQTILTQEELSAILWDLERRQRFKIYLYSKSYGEIRL